MHPRPRPAPVAAAPSSGIAPDLRALFTAHAPAIRRFLRDLLRDAAAADEATQETFVRAHARLASLEDPQRARAWLLGIARYVFLEELRRRRTRPLAATPSDDEELPRHDSALSPEQILLFAEAHGQFEAALARLGEERRTVFLLYSDHRLSYVEIAEIVGHDVTHVRNELHRARQSLRAALGDYFERAT